MLSVCLMMLLLGSIIFAGQVDSILALGIPYKSAGDVECGSILPRSSIFLKRQALGVVRSFLVGISRYDGPLGGLEASVPVEKLLGGFVLAECEGW